MHARLVLESYRFIFLEWLVLLFHRWVLHFALKKGSETHGLESDGRNWNAREV